MPFEFIRYEKRDRVAYLTIDRPERLNALHPPASAEMRRALRTPSLPVNTADPIFTTRRFTPGRNSSRVVMSCPLREH